MPTEPSPTQASAPRAAAAPPAAPEFVGVVTARRSAVVAAQVSARIEKLPIHAGHVVKAGELVVKLDRTQLETELAQAVANERAAQSAAGGFGAAAAGLQKSLLAEQRLHKLGVSSKMAVVNAGAQLGQVQGQGGEAAGRAIAAKAAREMAEKNLARTEIVAPLDGVVTNLKVHEGEVAQLGAPLARVFDPSDLLVRFAVPREHRAGLRLGQRVELTVEGAARPVVATITNISGAQEPPIHFTVVEADIDDAKLAPGELAVASAGRVRIADARGAKP